MHKKIKFLIASIYIISLTLVLYGFFTFIDITEITNYSYIKDNSLILVELSNQNPIIFGVLFFIFSVVWILLLGFATPILLISGFIFGKYLGTLISLFGFTIGCTLLYFLAGLYFKDLIIKRFSKKIEKFQMLFNKNEFFYYLIFRLSGGGGIPFAIQNVLPVIFGMKLKNYFYSSLLGLIPSTFIINSLGSGIEKLIEKNENLSLLGAVTEPGIYYPLIGFGIILIISFLIKKIFFNK